MACEPGPCPSDRMHARYLYAIVPARTASAPGAPGLGDVDPHVEVLTEASLSAVVGPVPASLVEAASALDEEHRPGRERTLGAVEAAVRDHERVVERVLERATSVLPIRFGTVLPSSEAARELLGRNEEELGSCLEALRGRREWGLKLYWDTDSAEESARTLTSSPGTTDPDADRPGHRFFAAKRAELTRADRRQDVYFGMASALEEALQSVGIVQVQMQVHAGVGASPNACVLDATVLVAQDDEERFLGAIESVLRGRTGLSASISGPWPPYSFVGGLPLAAQ